MAQITRQGELGLFFSFDFKKVLQDQAKWTSDIPYLNQFENHYVFVYGTLKRGMRRSEILTKNQQCKFCGVAVTEFNELDLLLFVDESSAEGHFPVLFDHVSKSRNAKVKGELWLVPTEVLLQLDKIEGNGYMFEREWTSVWVGTEKVHAFCYYGIKEFWRFQNLIDLPIMKSNGKQYHFYHGMQADKLASMWKNTGSLEAH
jgi:gamma-glutamylcyclotransferase (GGCT)/AIG2-like uncharacterized protein YtfP